jgi:fructose-1,6-bisphosphatase/sedoheptulose 1,7-bisphosphatase-like protein
LGVGGGGEGVLTASPLKRNVSGNLKQTDKALFQAVAAQNKNKKRRKKKGNVKKKRGNVRVA